MQIKTETSYPIIRNKPVAKFTYKGSHSKRVRRTVLLTEIRQNILRGYEVREGNEVRDLEDMVETGDEVIKSFSRTKVGDLERFSLASCAAV